MGSNDLRVAERAAEVFLLGNVTWLILSGGLGYLTKVACYCICILLTVHS